MDATMDISLFRYTALENIADWIRVVTILPSRNGFVCCSIQHVKWKDGGYNCLSYCWGDDPSTDDIKIDDGANSGLYPVRRNLYNFLREAGERGIQEPLWIDAISIDPNNAAEKALTISMNMGKIYETANKTFMWLNVPITPLNTFYDLRSEIARASRSMRRGRIPLPDFDEEDSMICCARLRWMRQDIRSIFNRRNQGLAGLVPHDAWRDEYRAFDVIHGIWISRIRDQYDLIRDILSNEYWSRAWITSEVILSKSARILAPRGTLNFNDIVEFIALIPALDQLANFFSDPPQFREFDGIGAKQFEQLSEQQVNYAENSQRRLTLSHALEINAPTHCSLELDRVFSIYPLLNPSFAAGLAVDYTLTPEQLYVHIVSAFVQFNAHTGTEIDRETEREARSEGRELYFSVESLKNNMRINASGVGHADSMGNVLEFFSQMPPTRNSNTSRWATPEETNPEDQENSDESDTGDQQQRSHFNLVGLYTAVYVDNHAFLVIEQLFPSTSTTISAADLFDSEMNCINYPRAWILQGNRRTCYQGTQRRYNWRVPPLPQIVAGPSNPPGDGGDAGNQGGAAGYQGGSEDDQGEDDDHQAGNDGYQAGPNGYQAGPDYYQEGHDGYQTRLDNYQRPNDGHQVEHGDHQGEHDGYPAANDYYQGGVNGYQGWPDGYQESPGNYQSGDPDYQGGQYDYQGEHFGNQGEHYGYHEGTYNDHDGGNYNTHPGGYYNGHGQRIAG